MTIGKTMAEARWYLHRITKGTWVGNYEGINWDM